MILESILPDTIGSQIAALELGFLTDTVYLGNTLLQYIIFVSIVLASFILGKTIYYLFKNHVTRFTQKTATRIDDILLKIMQGPLVLALVVVGLIAGVQILTIPPDLEVFIETVLSVIISLTVIWFVIRLVDVVVDEYMHPFAAKTETQLDEQLIPVVKKVLRALILIFGVITIISNFGYDITALITGLGIGGIAIALAAQETLGNMFGGVTLFMDRPFAIGDRVKVGDVYGDVVDIGMRSSKIQNLDNNVVIIPNSILSKSIVENYVRPSRKIKQKFVIGVTYDTLPNKVEEAIEIIKNAVKSTEGVTKDEPLVWFTEFAESSLNLTCIYWLKSLDYWGTSKNELNMKILKELNKAKIDIAFPTRTVHLEK